MRIHYNLCFSGLILFSLIFSCTSNQQSKPTETMKTYEKGTYGYDLQLLQKHKKPLELKSGDARILISPEYQGRVMTSTAKGDTGKSYGWINHNLIASDTLFSISNTDFIVQVRETSHINIVFHNDLSFFEDIVAAIIDRSIQGSCIFNHLDTLT